jgi:hypothetical protein
VRKPAIKNYASIYRIERINTFSIQVGKGTPIQAMVGGTFIDADFGLAYIYGQNDFLLPFPAPLGIYHCQVFLSRLLRNSFASFILVVNV